MKTILWVISVALFALMAVGCGKDDSSADPAVKDKTPTAADSPAKKTNVPEGGGGSMPAPGQAPDVTK